MYTFVSGWGRPSFSWFWLAPCIGWSYEAYQQELLEKGERAFSACCSLSRFREAKGAWLTVSKPGAKRRDWISPMIRSVGNHSLLFSWVDLKNLEVGLAFRSCSQLKLWWKRCREDLGVWAVRAERLPYCLEGRGHRCQTNLTPIYRRRSCS